MSLKAGIVGLPNVGKSTLFNAITKKNILAANYPFATIEPNVGVVTVPDYRLDKLTEMNDGDKVCVEGIIEKIPTLIRLRGNMNKMSFRIETDNTLVNVVIFNRGFKKLSF